MSDITKKKRREQNIGLCVLAIMEFTALRYNEDQKLTEIIQNATSNFSLRLAVRLLRISLVCITLLNKVNYENVFFLFFGQQQVLFTISYVPCYWNVQNQAASRNENTVSEKAGKDKQKLYNSVHSDSYILQKSYGITGIYFNLHSRKGDI